jgi:hypothetical protein
MNSKGQFYIVGVVILGIAMIMFFMLAYSYKGDDGGSSYILMFKMKDAKNSIGDCLRSSLDSGSNLTENLENLKEYYNDDNIHINYKDIKFTNITYESKNISYIFNQTYILDSTANTTIANIFYNISNNGFAGNFNGTLNYTGYFSGFDLINISENRSTVNTYLKSSSSVEIPHTTVLLYDKFENCIVNNSLVGNSTESGNVHYYVLNISNNDDNSINNSNGYTVFILGYDIFSNCKNENITSMHISGYLNTPENKTYINITINGSFEGTLSIKSDYKNYSIYINESENLVFNDIISPVSVYLTNTYGEVVLYNILDESNNNFSENRYMILNKSVINDYNNIIYGSSSKLYVSLHDINYYHNITIYSPQIGKCLKGRVVADVSIINPNIFYESINNTYELMSWNIH